jgi:hypothetical protein
MTEVREPSSVIELVETIQQYHARTKVFETAPLRNNKEVLDLFLAVPLLLEQADFYEVEADFVAAAWDAAWNIADGKLSVDVRFDSDHRLPSKVSAFWTPKMNMTLDEDSYPALYLAYEDTEGWVDVVAVSPYVTPLRLGSYNPRTGSPIHVVEDIPLEEEKSRFHQVLLVGGLCSLINQPGFVITEPAGSRQQRRAAQRVGGYAPTAWHKISWNIGEAAKAKVTRDEPTRCMPLHYTRGHWRKAEEGWNNVEQRKDGLWYQWIEGYWSGHPAFGIKRSYHAPKLARAG